MNDPQATTELPVSPRRSFLTEIKGRLASVAAVAAGTAALAHADTVARFEPARHDKDDWLDKLPGKHRFLFDTTSPDGLGDALLFASNYIRTNRTDYGLQPADLAVVMVLRHRSTPFAYSDAIWAKYGPTISARCKFDDPKTNRPPKQNVYNVGDYGEQLGNRGVTFDSLFKQGVQLAVCSSSTRAFAGEIAAATGATVDAVNAELIASINSNARMVPAGIVAVNRAQERGYSLARI